MSKKENSKQKHGEADIVRLVDEIVVKAVDSGASDVHFEPAGAQFLIKYRLDGVLNNVAQFPINLGETIVSRLKVMANLVSYRTDIPQEGRIEMKEGADKRVVDQRLAVFPTIYGERAVVRLFYTDQGLESLDQLGYSEFSLTRLQSLAKLCRGLILATGPAGSGKTTTLAAIIRYILQIYPGKSVITVEDPVERRIEGATQIQISKRGNLDYPTALRSLMRQDPEVIMIGEIRDGQTAKIAVEAALTGHLLLSTMHSGSPATALLRLLEMGIEPYQVASSVTAVINQRLLRKLCTACRRQDENSPTFVSDGCEACLHTGYHGRVLLAEMVELDEEIRQAVLEKVHMNELESLFLHRGLMPLKQKGRIKVNQGITSLAELESLGEL